MVKRYASFVVRCWQVGGGERRIEIEHVQSGTHTRVLSMAAAMAWMDGCCVDPGGQGPPPRVQTSAPARTKEEAPRGGDHDDA